MPKPETTRPFRELVDAMSPESRARAEAKATALSQTTPVPYVIRWKRDYLKLSDKIETFQEEYLKWVEEFKAPEDNPSQGGRLLKYHLDRCRELLWAEVNGGLDEEYQDEMKGLENGV